MFKYNNILKVVLRFLISILIYTLFITILSYFSIVSDRLLSIINFIFICILMFISGYELSKTYDSKGYLAGIIMGVINMIILLLISVVLRSGINGSTLLYYLILIMSSTIGGMTGINFKIKTDTN